ncbi:MAG: hypothetical protein HYU78_03530 [Rhodocyclales bacterium]|nr:hypothetical protein [Rhodocyclales bacterium]
MIFRTQPHHLWLSLRHIAGHVAITLLAVGIAFALPQFAEYILYQWWPLVRDDSQMLLLTEIGFAAALVLLLNFVSLTWHYRRKAAMSSVASLVHVHEPNRWISRRRKQDLLRRLPWKRDVTIMAVTGYGTFSAADADLRHILQECYEVRVMLMNPYSAGARNYVAAHPDPDTALAGFRRELAASIAYLRALHAAGRKVALKLYDEAPFWKLVFTGEHAWVRCCHDCRDFGKYPEYVFALQTDKPARGFFPAFYTYFLNQWQNPQHPDYNFDSDELVYRDGGGQEFRREPYPLPADAADGDPAPVLLTAQQERAAA